jgi:hypothetical protein
VYIRVVRFTGVTSKRVEELLARIDEADGPPPEAGATGLQVVFDETQGTAVVLQLFETEEDMQAGDRSFGAMDPGETPGTRVSVDMGELRVDVSARGR